jgi:Fe-S-cluster containining protein
MTKEEAAVLTHAAPSSIRLQFRPIEDKVGLKAGPCPLFAFNTCLVYKVRPYNCRRFACMRPDVKAEPFELDGGNLLARVKTSRVARRLAVQIQRKAQRWARTHGWQADT